MAAVTQNLDRRSNMVTSSVNQPMKKGGAGAYSWGAVGSVTDFVSTPVMQSSVTLAPAPQVVIQAAQPFTGSLGANAFPSLGSTVVSSGAATGAWAGGSQALFQRAPQPISAPIVTQSFGTATYNVGSTYDPKPVKMVSGGYVGEQDRRSRMATSTVKAVEKKGGAGTANWGVATEIGYAATPVTDRQVAMGPAPIVTQVVSSPYGGSLGSTQQFPVLGAQTIGSQPLRTCSSPTAAGWQFVPATVTAQTAEFAAAEKKAAEEKKPEADKKEEAKEEQTDAAGKKKDCTVM